MSQVLNNENQVILEEVNEISNNDKANKEIVKSKVPEGVGSVNEIEQSALESKDTNTIQYEDDSSNDYNNLQVNDDGLPNEDRMSTDVEPHTDKNKTSDNFTKLAQLPLARIKNLMKLDDDVTIVSAESVFAITKTTELFVKLLTEQAFGQMQGQKRKTLMKKDLEQVLQQNDIFSFLEGAFE